MNSLSFALSSLRLRPLQSALCVLAVAAGIGLLCLIMLISSALNDVAARNSRGIDIVVGAQGSPLQLILSTIYHADVPTGNISGGSAAIISRHPQIRNAIPLSLGDSYRGYRIVGTTPDYLGLYNAKIAEGTLWSTPMQAVAGALTELNVGDSFHGAHGLMDGGHTHDHDAYTVTGKLAPTGTVIDRLILTSVQSVYELHRTPEERAEDHAHDHHEHDHHEHNHHDDHAHDHDHAHETESTPHAHGPDLINYEVTALLIQSRGPVAAINLPREINRTDNMLAVQPSYEIARFMRSMGFGRRAVIGLGIGMVVFSTLMILATLAASLAARRYDLVVLRVLGASPFRLLRAVLAEGVILGLLGGTIGIIAGHALAVVTVRKIGALGGLVDPAQFIHIDAHDGWLLLLAVGASLGAALIPAVMAARTDMARILARGRV